MAFNGQVTEIIIDSQGTGYTSAPTITLTGGGGSGATANAIAGYLKGSFVKLNKDDGQYPNGPVVIKLYRPQQVTNTTDTVFYEFGEKYNIVTDLSGNRYHSGMLQDQGLNQPATFKFTEGDYFLTVYNVPQSVIIKPIPYWSVALMAMNYDDYYPSGQNSSGRAVGVFTTAKRLDYPTLVRFSGSYLLDTDVNKMSLYREDDQDTYNRTYGPIQRFTFREGFIRVFFQLKVGFVPLRQAVVQTTTGNDILAQSDKLLNSIKYDITDYGIGNLPLSLASSKYADYFCDPINGKVVRASHNGNEAISVIYNCNSFFGNQLKAFNGSLLASTQNNSGYPNMPIPTIYGFIDQFTGNYIIAAEKVDRWQNGLQRLLQNAFTVSFSDNENKFISFLSFESEAGGSIGNLLYTFKNGILYTHDGDKPCNYYGVQYNASVTAIANQNFLNDKAYLVIRESASDIWYGEEVNTSLGQQSKIPIVAFEVLEGNPCAPFLRDINSPGGLINGVPMKGKWLSIKLTITPSAIQTISVVVVKYNAYPH